MRYRKIAAISPFIPPPPSILVVVVHFCVCMLQEFVTSLFFVLEGKRLERTFERSDRLMLLCAPFEKKDYVGVDTDTRYFSFIFVCVTVTGSAFL